MSMARRDRLETRCVSRRCYSLSSSYLCLTNTRRYSPSRPYWEAVLLAKKLLLILAANTVLSEPTHQAFAVVAINAIYLVHFERKAPMLVYPATSTRMLKGGNLFHAVERTAALASLVGSLLALAGAYKGNWLTLVGAGFALVNAVYVVFVIAVFYMEETRGRVEPEGGVLAIAGGEGFELLEFKEWQHQVQLLSMAALKVEVKEQMINELDLMRGKVRGASEARWEGQEGRRGGLQPRRLKRGARNTHALLQTQSQTRRTNANTPLQRFIPSAPF